LFFKWVECSFHPFCCTCTWPITFLKWIINCQIPSRLINWKILRVWEERKKKIRERDRKKITTEQEESEEERTFPPENKGIRDISQASLLLALQLVILLLYESKGVIEYWIFSPATPPFVPSPSTTLLDPDMSPFYVVVMPCFACCYYCRLMCLLVIVVLLVVFLLLFFLVAITIVSCCFCLIIICFVSVVYFYLFCCFVAVYEWFFFFKIYQWNGIFFFSGLAYQEK